MADRPSGPLLPIGLLAIIGAAIYSIWPLGNPPVIAPRGPTVAEAKKESPASSATAEGDPLRPLYEYLDMQKGRGVKPVSGLDNSGCDENDQHGVRFLVTTVPDPLDSNLAQSFDRAVDAIQNAIQDSGYVLDRFWLPWRREGLTRWNVSRIPPDLPDGFFSVSTRPVSSDVHRRLPGTLLFRGTTPPGEQLVVVFLVGETPTHGIQREAMTAALDAIVKCPETLPCAKTCTSPEVRILGPYFSGSTDSLHHLLRSWNSEHPGRFKTIQIVSGSATVDGNVDDLTFDQASFQATVVPDRILTRAFHAFLRSRLHVKPETDIALFVEGGTSYGSGYKETSGSQQADKRQAQSPEIAVETAAPSPDDVKVRFVVSFPLHVAQLRSYQKDVSRNTASAGRAPWQALELALDAPESAFPDVLPTQDARMSASIADLVLSSSVETIRKENIRFVGIAASDSRDILFLARRIQQTAANVTLFTFGSDLLFTHPDYERYLRGMLVITPYPLFPANQSWTGSEGVRFSFAGSTEQGIYNAALYLVWDRDCDPETAEPPFLLEYRAPSRPEGKGPFHRPPIWITAVGRHGFWPVDIISDYDDADEYVLSEPAHRLAAEPQGPKGYRPPGAVLAFVLIEAVFLCVIALYGVFRRAITPGGEEAAVRGKKVASLRKLAGRAESVFSIWSTAAARDINRTYLATLLVLFTLVQATLAVFALRTFDFLPSASAIVGFAILVLVLLIVLAGRELGSLLSSSWRPKGGARGAWLHAAEPTLFLAAIGIVLVRYWSEIFRMGEGEAVALYARVLDLTSTISPLLPFLLSIAVLALWAVSNLRRAFLLEAQEDLQPLGEEGFRTLPGLQEQQLVIGRLLADPRRRAIALLAPVLAFIPFYRMVNQPFDTIDGQRWSLLFKICLLCCYAVILYSVALFVVLWRRLRKVLQRLSGHPIAEAFKRLPESVAASPWRLWRAVPSLIGLEESVSLLRALVNLGQGRLRADYWKALEKRADRASALLEDAVIESSSSLAESFPTRRELRRVLAEAMAQVLEALEEVWRHWPGPADGKKLHRPTEKEQGFGVPELLRREEPAGIALWVRAAEEYVALRLSFYIRYVFLQIKNLLTFTFLGFLLVVAAITSYPFAPKHPVMALVWVGALVCVALVAWAFIAMERDRILSFIGKTKPGEVTLSFEFMSSMTIYVIVPLLTLLATQFPDLGDILFSVFTPAMKSPRG